MKTNEKEIKVDMYLFVFSERSRDIKTMKHTQNVKNIEQMYEFSRNLKWKYNKRVYHNSLVAAIPIKGKEKVKMGEKTKISTINCELD